MTREEILKLINRFMYLNGSINEEIQEYHLVANCGGSDPMNNDYEVFLLYKYLELDTVDIWKWDTTVSGCIDRILFLLEEK